MSRASVRLTNPIPRRSRSVTTSIKCRRDRPSGSSRLHDQAVAGPSLGEQVVQGGAGLELAAGLVDEDPVAAGGT